MKLGGVFLCECLHQRLHRKIRNWLFCWWSSLKGNWFFSSLYNSLTLYGGVCSSRVENKRSVSLKDGGSCKRMRACLCSDNRYIIVWLRVYIRKYKRNHLLSILCEFQYSGASKVGWEAQLRGNFMYWTQQGDCKTERQRHTHWNVQFLCAQTQTHYIFWAFSNIKTRITKSSDRY